MKRADDGWNLTSDRWRLYWRLPCVSVLLLASLTILPRALSSTAHTAASQITFNYAEVLQKAISFYDAQRSGILPVPGSSPSTRTFSWRGNSATHDGADQGVDLVGGWYDAGDHVKFGFPMAGSVTLLAWGALEYRDAFSESQQLPYMLDNLRWANDYLIKAHISANELYGQVGKGDSDHAWWGPAEVMPMARPAYKISPTCPGSELAAETAAAMAASALVFKSSDASYANTLITHAKQLYLFADTYRGKYSDCIKDAASYYNSWSGYNDELVWGALWLYKATGDSTYLSRAEGLFSQISGNYHWTHSWDDKSYGAFVLLTQLTGKSTYRQATERWLDYWTSGYNGERVTYTPGGLAWLDQWGPLRYAATTAFIAAIYSDYLTAHNLDATRASRYMSFAEAQGRYILGDNPLGRSYVVGFGNRPPSEPHHRTSHGSWANNLQEPEQQRHLLYGALVGGPDNQDQFMDDRGNYVTNEVALDYNAGLVGLMARLYQTHGGQPLAEFPLEEIRDQDELYISASLNATGTSFTEVKALISNRTAWPARLTDQLTLRYYFTLEPNTSPSAIQLSSGYTQCGQPKGPTRYDGDVYYVEVSCAGVQIFPGGSSDYQKEVQLRISSTGAWDPTNDWSAQSLTGGTPSKNDALVLFDHGQRVWGRLPGEITEQGCADEPVTEPTPTPLPASEPEQGPEGDQDTDNTLRCEVDYSLQSDWGSGFVADVLIRNLSEKPVDGWKLSWKFAGNQHIGNAWNGVASQSGPSVQVSDADWNAAIQSGASASFGFQADYSGSNSLPNSFTLNGVACSVPGLPVAQGGNGRQLQNEGRPLTAQGPRFDATTQGGRMTGAPLGSIRAFPFQSSLHSEPGGETREAKASPQRRKRAPRSHRTQAMDGSGTDCGDGGEGGTGTGGTSGSGSSPEGVPASDTPPTESPTPPIEVEPSGCRRAF